jgi:hypothetical protein
LNDVICCGALVDGDQLSSSGSLAKFAAIRRASSFASSLAAERRSGSSSKWGLFDTSELPPILRGEEIPSIGETLILEAPIRLSLISQGIQGVPHVGHLLWRSARIANAYLLDRNDVGASAEA